MKRIDYPLCPYCKREVVGFGAPSGLIKDATVYCPSAECTGKALDGSMTGYDIRFAELTNKY